MLDTLENMFFAMNCKHEHYQVKVHRDIYSKEKYFRYLLFLTNS
jgi:hypothetical protein